MVVGKMIGEMIGEMVGEMVGEKMVGEMVVGEMVVGTSAFIVWVKGQQAVQPVLLFTPAVTITSLQGDPSFSTIEVDKVKLID